MCERLMWRLQREGIRMTRLGRVGKGSTLKGEEARARGYSTYRRLSGLGNVLPHPGREHRCGRLGSRRASPVRRDVLVVAVPLLEVVMTDGVLGVLL